MHSQQLFPLDCTARMLPYAISKTMPPVFHFTATLTEEIDPDTLRQAVRDLAPRFPTLYARLRKGFFWDCLEYAPDHDVVMQDTEPCRPFPCRDGKTPLLRVLYHKNELAIEASHLTADGTAGIVYLSSLAARYLELRGHAIEKNRFVRDYRDRPTQTELMDGYRAVYEKPRRKAVPFEPGKAYPYITRRKDSLRRITRVQIPIDAMKRLLKEKYGGCTITEYLTAVYACALLQLYKNNPKKKRPIRLSVPADLRNFWEIDTLRNFSAVGTVTLRPELADCGFREILDYVRQKMGCLTRETMKEFICQTVSYLNMLNLVPGFVKRLIVCAGSLLVGKVVWPFSSSISNTGYIRLPPSLAAHIQSYTVVMGGFDTARIVCAAAGVNNTMTMTFSTVNESAVRDFCIAFFRSDGLPVDVTARDF